MYFCIVFTLGEGVGLAFIVNGKKEGKDFELKMTTAGLCEGLIWCGYQVAVVHASESGIKA